MQKKLESYLKRYDDLEQQQAMKAQQQKDHRQPREVLRDVGQGLKNVGGNIRDGVTTGVINVMSKPREFAHLIKNKFGSADNINQMSSKSTISRIKKIVEIPKVFKMFSTHIFKSDNIYDKRKSKTD